MDLLRDALSSALDASHTAGRFFGLLRFVEADTPEVWVLDAPLRYSDSQLGEITALPGYPTDGASIPRWLWPLAGPPLRDQRTARAAVIHDLLYDTAGLHALSRKAVDTLFARALLAAGVHPIKAALYYTGVRLGGWIGWRRAERNPAQRAERARYLRLEPGD